MDPKDLDEEEPDLLFVLTDPSTGQRPLAGRQAVNRYVQTYTQRKRKQVAAKRLSTKGPMPFVRLAPLPDSGSSAQHSTPGPQSNDDGTHIKAPKNIPDVGSRLANVADSSAFIDRHRLPGRQSDSPSSLLGAAAIIATRSSPTRFLDTAKLDPFSSSVAPLTLSMNRALHHFLKMTIPRVFPNSSQDSTFKQWFVQQAFGAPRMLFAMVASAVADTGARRGLVGPRVLRRSGQQLALSPAVSEIFQYKTKAIRLLNQSLAVESEATAISTLYSILCLLTVNWVLGEQDEIAVHIKGLEKLIAVRGGFHGIPFAIVENMLGTLYCSLAMAGSLPRASSTPTLQTMPLSAQETIMSAIDPDLREMGFAILDDPFVSTLFSLRLQQNFSDRREALFFRECFHSIQVSRSALEPELERYMFKRYQLRSEALSAAADDMVSGVAVSPAEETCRLALLIFWIANYFPSQAIFRRFSGALKTALERSDAEHSSFWKPYPKLLMWVLFLGAYTSFSTYSSAAAAAVAEAEGDQGAEEGEVRRWFIFHLRRVAKDKLRLRGWEEVRAILKQHFYIDRVYRRRFMEIWEEVTS